MASAVRGPGQREFWWPSTESLHAVEDTHTKGMVENSGQIPPEPCNDPNPWAKVTMWVGIVFLFLAASVYVFKSLRDLPGDVIDKTGSAMGKAGSALKELASAFHQGTVTTSFLSYATTLHPNHYLQFATLNQHEVFTRKDEATTGFGYIPLPEVVVEAQAPVEYTYFLDLNAKWELVLKDSTLHVLAPRIQFNKPSVDASAIQYEIKKGSVFRNTAQVTESLKESVTFLARVRARENIPLVRETARKQTCEFVEKWLVKSFTDGRKYPVKVYFPEEPSPVKFQAAEALKD